MLWHMQSAAASTQAWGAADCRAAEVTCQLRPLTRLALGYVASPGFNARQYSCKLVSVQGLLGKVRKAIIYLEQDAERQHLRCAAERRWHV